MTILVHGMHVSVSACVYWSTLLNYYKLPRTSVIRENGASFGIQKCFFFFPSFLSFFFLL